MVLKRSIDGRIRLHAGIKLWGTMLIVVALVLGGVAYRIAEFHKAAEECRATRGVWIGGAMFGGYCAPAGEDEDNW